MKNIVFILGEYYPNPSPNGFCVRNLIDELKKKYDITVICFNKDNSSDHVKIENINIYLMNNWRNKLRNFSTTKLKYNPNLIARIYYKSIIKLTRIIRGLVSITSWPTSEKWFIKKAMKCLMKINLEREIDAIVTISIPYDAHICGLYYKYNHNAVKWLTYTLDPFTNHEAIHKFVFNKSKRYDFNIKSECEVHNTSDMNFIMDSRKDWCESLPEIDKNKIEVISFPLIKEYITFPNNKFKKDNKKINLVFAGTFYRKIRNPEYLLKLITTLNHDRIVLHLFSRSDCDDIINKYIKLSEGRIINHGIVSIEEVHAAMQHSDILVNVGNTVAEQLPSKLFEYISSGKPIINLYSYNLSYQDIFNKYPIYISIKQDINIFNENIIRFKDFCEENTNKQINYSVIEDLYHESTPKYIAEIFEKQINL